MFGKIQFYHLDGSLLLESEVTKTPTLIGRTAPCDLIINHHSISRQHGVIDLVNGQLVLKDKNSTNGIKFNGHRIDHINLNADLEFQIGDLKVHFTPAFNEEATRISHFSDLDGERTTISSSNIPPQISVSEAEVDDDDIFSAKTYIQPSSSLKNELPNSAESLNLSEREPAHSEENIESSVWKEILLILISIGMSGAIVYFSQFHTQETLKITGAVTVLSLALGYIFSYLSRIQYLESYIFISGINFLFSTVYLLSLILSDEFRHPIAILTTSFFIGVSLFAVFNQINLYSLASRIDSILIFVSCTVIALLVGYSFTKSPKVTYNLSILSNAPPQLWSSPTPATHPIDNILLDLETHWQ